MDNTLGDFLSDEPQPETEAAPIAADENLTGETVIDTAAEERLRDEHGRFKAKEETGVENTAEPEVHAEPVPPTEQADRLPQGEYAALKDERRKRQELEARLAQYDAYYAQQQAQQAQQPAPDMFEDPEGFKARLAADIRQELMNELTPQLNQHRTLTRAEMSEIAARQKHEDYDDTVEIFKEAMATNPFLLTQLQQAADPATFAYNAGKQFQQAKAYGGEAPPSREQIEAEIREKILAEVGLNRPQAPSTFAGDRSVGARSGPAWTGPTSIGDILR